MKRHDLAVLGFAALLWAGGVSGAAAGESESTTAIVVAQASGTQPRELQPRYEPAPVEEKSSYNDSYIFGMTRGVADSTIHPAVKAPLFFFTIPLDLVFLPFATIGGFFG